MPSMIPPSAELKVWQSRKPRLYVLEAAGGIKVICLVVIERGLLAEPTVTGYGSALMSTSYGS